MSLNRGGESSSMSAFQSPSSSPRLPLLNLRVIALCVAFFYVGLQFKYLLNLFGATDNDDAEMIAWVPDELYEFVGMDDTITTQMMRRRERKNKIERYTANARQAKRFERTNNDNEIRRRPHVIRETADEESASAERPEPQRDETEREKKRPMQPKRRHHHEQASDNNDNYDAPRKTKDEDGASAAERPAKRRHGKTKKKRSKQPKRTYEASNYTAEFVPLPWTLPKPTPTRYKSSEEFMAEYSAKKRKNNVAPPWDDDGEKKRYAEGEMFLPKPIIALNFPKSATLTLSTYFGCGGLTSIHTSSQQGRLAVCLMENQLADRPPMTGCDTHKERKNGETVERGDVKPIDFISDIGLQGPPCYYPGVHEGSLDNIAKHYPNTTIMMVVRNATSWHRSMNKWGSIMHRWKKYCYFDASGGMSGGAGGNGEYWRNMYNANRSVYNREEREANSEEYWVNFYQAHVQKIREFAMEHLSLTYVEAELNDDLGKMLEKYTGVSADCVMDCHPGPKWIKEVGASSRCHPVGQNPALLNAIGEEKEEEEDGGENEEEGGDDDDGAKEEVDDDEQEIEE